MSQAVATVPYRPLIHSRGDDLFTSSTSIAKDFEKRHGDVLRAIDDLNCSPEFRERNFALTWISGRSGSVERAKRSFEMTKDGFAFLVMGFTGEKAGRFKELYIAEFNRMREELDRLKSQAIAASAPAPIDMRNPAHLALAFAQVMEIAKEAEERAADEARQKQLAIDYIDETAPLVELAEEVMATEALETLSNVARLCGTAERRFFDFLEGRYLHRENGVLVPYAKYRAEGLFKVKYTHVNGRLRTQTFVTGKGVAVIKAALKGSRRDLLSHLGRLPAGMERITSTVPRLR